MMACSGSLVNHEGIRGDGSWWHPKPETKTAVRDNGCNMQCGALVLMTVLTLGCYRSPLLTRSSGGGASVAGTADPERSPFLVSEQASPGALALDADNVYWLNLGTHDSPLSQWRHSAVMKCSKQGCPRGPTTLAHGRTSPSMFPPAFAADGGYVYWFDSGPDISDNVYRPGGGILRCPVSGCGTAPQVVAPAAVNAMAIAGARLFLTHDQAKVDAYPSAGAERPSADLWSGCTACVDYSIGIATDRTDVFWTTTNQVMRCAQTGCGGTPSLLLPPSRSMLSLGAIAIDDGNVYFAHDEFYIDRSQPGAILGCAKSGCGASPWSVATSLPPVWNLATDGIDVYWSQIDNLPSPNRQTGMIRRCPVSGCIGEPETIASGITGWLAIAVDSSFVYWTDAGDDEQTPTGRIWRVSKS